jgi:hypothetical protein
LIDFVLDMMPKEPEQLVDILAALPGAADYDAAYAALMATDAGRRFLAELTRRNRNADTQMILGAMARVEAAIRGDPAPHIPAIVTRELTEVAAALDRAAAALAVAQVPTAAILAAVERIQDIAFVLHERPVELTLCDALDAAVRDIADAVAAADADGQTKGLRRVTELLRALARRVNAMIALALEAAVADLSSVGVAEAASAAAPTPSEPADTDHATLAAAVAMLAATMPAESEAEPLRDASTSGAAPTVRPEAEAADDFAPLGALEALSEEELLALFS